MKSIGEIPANYDSNQTTQSEARAAELAVAKQGLNLLEAIFYGLYSNRTTCTADYLRLCNTYAVNGGLLGRTTEQGQFEGVQTGMNLCGYHFVIRWENNGKFKPQDFQQAENWIATILQKFAPSFGGRMNNQYLFYTGGMMGAAILQKNRSNIVRHKDLLVSHMRAPDGKGNFRDGFIRSELDRFTKVIGYHNYYINLLWFNLIIIKVFNIPFPWDEFKEPLRLVCVSLADKSTNTPGDASLFINYLKKQKSYPMSSYNDSNAYNEMRSKFTITDGNKHMGMWNYLFNNGGVPSGFLVSGVNVFASLYVKALNFWNTSIVPK